jgi:hypothetical protein
MRPRSFDELKTILKKNPRDLDDKCDLFKYCTVKEYKTLALFALDTLCNNDPQRFCQCLANADGWAAHHITKAIFEEQSIFDPYEDKQFIADAEVICPWYIRRYVKN